jgi:hypothetical protein
VPSSYHRQQKPTGLTLSIRANRPKHLKRGLHRKRRERARHDLIVILDDVTSEMYYAQLAEEETTWGSQTAILYVVCYAHDRGPATSDLFPICFPTGSSLGNSRDASILVRIHSC